MRYTQIIIKEAYQTQEPFNGFIGQALKDFESRLANEGMAKTTIGQRIRGAREFARYLIGDAHRYGERT